MPSIVELQEQHEAKSVELLALADKENPTADDAAHGERLASELDEIKSQLDELDAAKRKMASFKAKAVDAATYLNAPASKAAPLFTSNGNSRVEAVKGEAELDKHLKHGPFKGLGHLAYAIKQCGEQRPGFVQDGILGEWNKSVTKHDEFVKNLPASIKAAQGLNEFADSEGAIAVPVEIAAGIWQRTAGEDNLLTRIGTTPVAGNSLKLRAWNDKSRSGDVLFGGARAYWGAEAAQMTKSAPTFRDIDLKLNKLYVLMYATDELLADAPALEAELTKIAGASFVYKINKSIVRGTGAGEPVGLINADAKVKQTAVSAQGANTIVAQNVDEMFARRSPGSGKDMVWLYQLDAEAQLNKLAYATGTYSGQLVNMPPTGVAGQPNQTLKGRPMIECEHCSALGTEGDIILWDPTQHVAIVKSNGINQAASMHLRFDYDETAFRFTFRMDARSRWEAPMTPAQSSTTRSPIVTLNSTRT